MTNVTQCATGCAYVPDDYENVTSHTRCRSHDGVAELQYHAGMVRRWLVLVLSALMLLAVGCKKPGAQQQPVVVHVFRDLDSPYAPELDHRILDFQVSNPRLPSGSPIVIKTYSGMDYKTAIQSRFDKDIRVEVVILNSPTDAAGNAPMAANLDHAVDICAAVKACPADVPAFVSSSATGPNAQAAQMFVQALAQKK